MANIIKLPVVRIDRGDQEATVAVTVKGATLKRLRRRAREWGMDMDDTAAALIAMALAPPKR